MSPLSVTTLLQEEVNLRDGRVIIVHEADYALDRSETLIEKAARDKVEAERKAYKDRGETPDEAQVSFWNFEVGSYPLLAACSTMKDGTPLPTADDVYHWASTERVKWLNGARLLNPHWFLVSDKALKDKQEYELSRAQLEELRKKGEKPD